jgi:alpha/beta superfamily hydrolase
VNIPLTHDQEIITSDLYLMTILGTEQDMVALLSCSNVGTGTDHLAPHQTLLLLSGSRNQDPAATTPLGFIGRHTHQNPIVQHFDRPLCLIIALLFVVGLLRIVSHDGTVLSGSMSTEVAITTSDGLSLQGEVSVAADATAMAVLSHPHPMFGGDMYNPLIDHLFLSLPERGITALRYNFRGVGRSQGEFGDGVGEQQDAAAAFKAAADLVTDLPVWSVGWSFGADVSLSVDSDHLTGWVAIAAPLRILEPTSMPAGPDSRPTLLLVPEFDQYRSPESAIAQTESWEQTSVVTIPGGDHFLGGKATVVTEEIVKFLHHR